MVRYYAQEPVDSTKSTADYLESILFSKVKSFSHPTKHLHILVPAPLCELICTNYVQKIMSELYLLKV